jgi:hypothetical protein
MEFNMKNLVTKITVVKAVENKINWSMPLSLITGYGLKAIDKGYLPETSKPVLEHPIVNTVNKETGEQRFSKSGKMLKHIERDVRSISNAMRLEIIEQIQSEIDSKD